MACIGLNLEDAASAAIDECHDRVSRESVHGHVGIGSPIPEVLDLTIEANKPTWEAAFDWRRAHRSINELASCLELDAGLWKLKRQQAARSEDSQELPDVTANQRRLHVLKDNPTADEIEMRRRKPLKMAIDVQLIADIGSWIRRHSLRNHRLGNVDPDDLIEMVRQRARQTADAATEVQSAATFEGRQETVGIQHQAGNVSPPCLQERIGSPGWLVGPSRQDSRQSVATPVSIPLAPESTERHALSVT